MKYTKISTLSVFMLLMAGCELMQPSGTPTPSGQPSEPPGKEPAVSEPETLKSKREVDRLLRQAAVAFEDKRLITPVSDNAFYRYLRILTIDPGNERAEQGISNIVEKYLEWAIANAERRQFPAAIRYLNKAKSVDRSHPNIAAAEKHIKEQQSANRTIYPLPAAAVDEKTSEVIQKLYEIGRAITQHDARVIIVGRTDAEGRWIYQQLNKATPDRVRAEFEPGREPVVRLIY
ncbi:MAG: hypothetical protein WD356_05125 [Pseudomonadales bacterium]